jgi:valyl-tRNA synthetase
MGNIHDWCISRQLWWGHRIPAWHCDACKAITVSRETPSACVTCGAGTITQETDVLDTWFSSGLLPFTVFGWPSQGPGSRAQGSEDRSTAALPWTLTPDLAAFYPTSLLITGFDILFFWVARMIMLGTHFMLDVPMADGSPRTLAEAVPFREVYIHGLIRDANREKMSKTKGNVIDPIEIIQRFGTDAVRFTLASQASPGTDIAFNEKRTEGYRAFANKIWNAARFLFMNIDRAIDAGSSFDFPIAPGGICSPLDLNPVRSSAQDTIESRWILARLSQTAAAVDSTLADYRFDEAANNIYQFFWGDLCDWYVEVVKLRLNFEAGIDNAQSVAALRSLVIVFNAALRLLSPFMPFITEELWHALNYGNVVFDFFEHPKSVALTRYPQASDFACDETAIRDMEMLQELITTVRAIRKELGVPEKESAPIKIHAATEIAAIAQANADILAKLARVTSVDVREAALSGSNARSTSSFDVAVIYERQIDVAAERERLTKELAKLEKNLLAAERQLGNEAFMAKAPVHIVEGLRKQAAENAVLREKAKAAMDALPPAGSLRSGSE